MKTRITTGHTRWLRDRLRDARKSKGLHQSDIAELVGTTQQNIGHWERLRGNPKIDQFAAWARALDLQLVVDLAGLGDQAHVEVPVDALPLVRLVSQLGPEHRRLLERLAQVLPNMTEDEIDIIDFHVGRAERGAE